MIVCSRKKKYIIVGLTVGLLSLLAVGIVLASAGLGQRHTFTFNKAASIMQSDNIESNEWVEGTIELGWGVIKQNEVHTKDLWVKNIGPEPINLTVDLPGGASNDPAGIPIQIPGYINVEIKYDVVEGTITNLPSEGFARITYTLDLAPDASVNNNEFFTIVNAELASV